jgi:hypothetical protein
MASARHTKRFQPKGENTMDKKRADLEKIEGLKIKPQSDNATEALKGFGSKAVVLPGAKKKGKVVVKSLRIRKSHTTDSEMVGGLVAGDEVTIHETLVDGNDTWARIGDDQWAAVIYKGETYIKLEE